MDAWKKRKPCTKLKKQPEMVIVKWIDSASHLHGWGTINPNKVFKPIANIISCGMVAREDTNSISIIQNLHDAEAEEDNVWAILNDITIPKCAITEIISLRKGRD